MTHNLHLSIAGAAVAAGTDHFPDTGLRLSLEVSSVREPGRKDEKLDQAVKALIPAALERRQGILVIQRGYGKYTVCIDHEVPCGMTYESRF